MFLLHSVVASAPSAPHFWVLFCTAVSAFGSFFLFYDLTKEFGSLKTKKERKKIHLQPSGFALISRGGDGGRWRGGGGGGLCKGESRAAKSIHPTRVRGTALPSLLPSVQTSNVSLAFFQPQISSFVILGSVLEGEGCVLCVMCDGGGGKAGGGVNLTDYSGLGGKTHRLGDGF